MSTPGMSTPGLDSGPPGPPMPSRKRSVGDQSDTSVNTSSQPRRNKKRRSEQSPEHFSKLVKSRQAGHTRTGQACDRCKIRKIKCDLNPGACGQCRKEGQECLVTDRATNRTDPRGYVDELERKARFYAAQIEAMRKLLSSDGIVVQPCAPPAPNARASPPSNLPPGVFLDEQGNVVQDPSAPDQWSLVDGSVWVKNGGSSAIDRVTDLDARLAALESRPTEGYLGVLSDSNATSTIKGTKLSILGSTIDVASFEANEMEEPAPGSPSTARPLYNKSLMAFFQTIYGHNLRLEDKLSDKELGPVGRLEQLQIPKKDPGMEYVTWYFRFVHPFVPVLHQPSFVNLLTRIYTEPEFEATVCELVTVHMVFALILFQCAVRNKGDKRKYAHLNELSTRHYHWALSKFLELSSENTVTAVQGLAMIAYYTRSFPKPGCSALVAEYALSRAIALNFHRGQGLTAETTTIDNEVRKRIWWSILALSVMLNGRLGRPMPIRLEEFDVEFPVAVADEFITDNGISDVTKIGQCPTVVGFTTFKMVPLYLEMFSALYSVRRSNRPAEYVATVRALEGSMQTLEAKLPDELKPDVCHRDNRIYALYTQTVILEFYLSLRHPFVCMTKDAAFCAENSRVCEETAAKLLGVVTAIRKIKSLDTTWYVLAVYVGAMFSSLAAHYERRHETRPDEIAKLRGDMRLWMAIVRDFGEILGPKDELTKQVGTIVHRTLEQLEQQAKVNGQRTALPDHQPAHQTPPQPQPLNPEAFLASGDQQQQHIANTPGTGGFVPLNHQRNGGVNGGNGYYNQALSSPAHAQPVTFTSPLGYSDPLAPANHNGGSNGMPPPMGPAYPPADNAQYIYGAATGAPPTGPPPVMMNPMNPSAFHHAAVHPGVRAEDDWHQQHHLQQAAAAAHRQAQELAQAQAQARDLAQAEAQAQADAQLHQAQAQTVAHDGGGGWHNWQAAMANIPLNLGNGNGNHSGGLNGGAGGDGSSDHTGLLGGPPNAGQHSQLPQHQHQHNHHHQQHQQQQQQLNRQVVEWPHLLYENQSGSSVDGQ